MTPTTNNVGPTTSATERISAMLDERGKEHRVWPSGLVIWHDEGSWVYEYNPPKGDNDYWGGILRMTLRHCTPEQAIEATLGRGECRDEGCGTIAFKCSECGCWMLYDEYQEANLYAWRDDGIRPIFPHYCPNCGRKVVLQSSQSASGLGF